jgi:Ni,Fe-hydrogenase III large subunit
MAVNISASGPVQRASGVKWDIRKADPYSIYDRSTSRFLPALRETATTDTGEDCRNAATRYILEQAESRYRGEVKANVRSGCILRW